MKQEYKQKIDNERLMHSVAASLVPSISTNNTIHLSDYYSILPDNKEIHDVFTKLGSPESVDKLALKIFVQKTMTKGILDDYISSPKPESNTDSDFIRSVLESGLSQN